MGNRIKKKQQTISWIDQKIIETGTWISNLLRRYMYTLLTVLIIVLILLFYYLPQELSWLLNQWWRPVWNAIKLNENVESAIISLIGSIIVGFTTVGVTVYVTWKINKQTQHITEKIQFRMIDQQKKQIAFDQFYSKQNEVINELKIKIDSVNGEFEMEDFFDFEKYKETYTKMHSCTDALDDLDDFYSQNKFYFSLTEFNEAMSFIHFNILAYRLQNIEYSLLLKKSEAIPFQVPDYLKKEYNTLSKGFIHTVRSLVRYIPELIDYEMHKRIDEELVYNNEEDLKKSIDEVDDFHEDIMKILKKIEYIVTSSAKAK